MKITWLGQAGLLFEINDKKVVIDPYLSNSVAKIQPNNYRRKPIDERFLKIKPKVIILTHNHADHTDLETLNYYLNNDSSVLVLASYNAWNEVRKFGGLKNNYVSFNSGTTWSLNGVSFRAVYAEHSDAFAIGVVISACGKNVYVTGDTLYSEKVFDSLKKAKIETCFLPINGVGNNMNAIDANKFCKRVKAKINVPIHYGLFDEIDATTIDLPNKKCLEMYKEYEF